MGYLSGEMIRFGIATRLDRKENSIYDLIVRRFIAIFLPAQVKAETEILIDVSNRRSAPSEVSNARPPGPAGL